MGFNLLIGALLHLGNYLSFFHLIGGLPGCGVHLVAQVLFLGLRNDAE